MKVKYKIGKIEFDLDVPKKRATFNDGTKVTWKDRKAIEKMEDLFNRV